MSSGFKRSQLLMSMLSVSTNDTCVQWSLGKLTATSVIPCGVAVPQGHVEVVVVHRRRSLRSLAADRVDVIAAERPAQLIESSGDQRQSGVDLIEGALARLGHSADGQQSLDLEAAFGVIAEILGASGFHDLLSIASQLEERGQAKAADILRAAAYKAAAKRGTNPPLLA